MRTKIALLTSLAAAGALLPGAAWAQEAPAAAPAPAAEAPAAPAEVAPAAPAAEAPAAPAAEVTAAADGPTPMPGWVRIDSDGGGVQLWGGGTYPLSSSVGLAFDMYVFQGLTSLGELDVGPAITAGPVVITPMVGLQIDWTQRKAQALVPQLYVVGSLGPIYTEIWLQYYMNTVFNKDPAAPLPPVSNQIYVRGIFDYKINDFVAAGLELDLTHDSEADPGVVSLPIGLNVLLSNVGAASSFMAFLGYETKNSFANLGAVPDEDNANHLAGRLTFVHNF